MFDLVDQFLGSKYLPILWGIVFIGSIWIISGLVTQLTEEKKGSILKGPLWGQIFVAVVGALGSLAMLIAGLLR